MCLARSAAQRAHESVAQHRVTQVYPGFGHSENYLARGVKRRALPLELLVLAGASWDGLKVP